MVSASVAAVAARPRLSRRRRAIWLGVPAAVLAAAALGVVLAFGPAAVEVVAPEKDVAVQVFGLGTVEARILSRIGFEVSGRLAELHADHGQRVRAGDVLARLDAREREARLAQAEAAVAQARAAARETAATLDEVAAVAAQAEQTNQRRQALERRGTVSAQAAEESQLALDVARARLAQARGRVEIAQANLEAAQAAARLESVILAKHTLIAPYDATVVSRHRELGTALVPGEALFTLVDPETIWALAHVDEANAGGLRVGQGATVRLRSLPDREFPGTVARIDLESDRVTEERRVYIACGPHPPALYLGEQAEVFITTARLAEALLVPPAAVEEPRGATGLVWTVEEGKLARRTVQFGHRTLDGRLEIVAGVPAGAQVVARLQPGLREGRRASVRAALAGAPRP